MVHFNILRKVRRKQKSNNTSSRNHSAAPSPKNDGSSYFESSEEEDSYLSSDASFYSSSSGSSDYDDDDYDDGCSSDDVSCESGLSKSNESDTGTTLPCNMPNFIRAIAQYAPLDICKINHENTNTKTSEDIQGKAPGKIKKETQRSSSGGGGFKSFQQQVGGKFESMFKSTDTRKKASGAETSSTVNVVQTDREVHQVEKDNVSLFTEKFQKQFQDWADRAKKFESMHLLNAYNAQNEEDLNDTAADAATSPSVASQDIIESRNEVDEVIMDEPDERDEPVLSPRKARSLRLANRKTHSFRTRGRTKSEGHKESFQKMAIMSPRLTTNVIRPILSPRQQPSILSPKKPKKHVFSPKNCKVPCIRKRKDKATSRRREDDIDIDELVAHVIRKKSTEASYEQDENLFMHHQTITTDTDSAENRQQSDDFPDRQAHPEPEDTTAKQLELAQKEIEYLKRLLQEKGRVSDRDDEEKVTNNQASFNFSEIQSFESGLTSNQNNKDTSGRDSSESLMDRLYSHEEIFSQEDMFPFAENDFKQNSKSPTCDITSNQDEYGDNDLFWGNILVNTASGYDDHDDEVSLLSNTFSPRRYVKPKRISLRKS